MFVSFPFILSFPLWASKDPEPPCMFFFLLPLSVLFFSFFHHYPTALFCAYKCFLNGVLSSLSAWMSLLLPVGWVYLFRGNWCVDEWGNEVHPHLAAPLPESRHGVAGLRLELRHMAFFSTQTRMALSYPGGETQSLELIPQWGRGSVKYFFLRVCVCICMCVFVGRERKKKKNQPFTVSQSLSRARVCLAACVCISDFPCVFVSACISGWVGVQLSSRRTFGSRSPLPTSNCPSRPAELPNDFTYTSLICLGRVAATIWHFSLYMSFAASYRVKFNCTSPTVASVVGSPRFFFFSPSPSYSVWISSLFHNQQQTW